MTVILIGGDVCPVGNNQPLFQTGRPEEIFSDLAPEFQRADYSVVNLECPLVSGESPIEKDGAALRASVDCVNGLKAAKIRAVNLANNHVMDHGEPGLRSTMAACDRAGIHHFGAGPNLHEAGRPLIRQIDGHRVAFLGVAEREFSIAGKDSWGANPLDIVEIVRRLKRLRDECDSLVVLVHGGREHYPYPSPRLQNVCRFLVEEGANAVVCQHSHCAGCYEYYRAAPIVYGQGNLIFEKSSRRTPAWHEGFLVQLTLQPSGECHADWIPFSQSLDGPGAKRLSPTRTRELLNDLESRSREIESRGAVELKWLEYCRKQKYLYASRIRGHNRWLRFLNRKLHFSDWLYSKTTKLMLRNVVECEVHREVLETLWHDTHTDF